MNREPAGATVHVPGTPLPLRLQQAYGGLRRDRVTEDPAGAEWRVVQMRQGIQRPAERELLARLRPAYRWSCRASRWSPFIGSSMSEASRPLLSIVVPIRTRSRPA
jgi:hypothetical protein